MLQAELKGKTNRKNKPLRSTVMKKQTSKPRSKKAVQKKPATKKLSLSKPKQKAQGESELTDIVARLAMITENLAQTTERLAGLTARWSNPEEPHEEPVAQDITHQETAAGHQEIVAEEPPDFTTAPKAPEDGADLDDAKE